MRLISCYIERFGGLSQYAISFDDGVTVIQEPNGFGKTTLAEFIRAMFYGFPRKTKTLGKRQKYTPWGGGKFGGHLTFEQEGEQYRIERTFGATPKGDVFCVIDLKTGRKSDRFSEEIGLELFGLDADSFERSTYLPQLHEGGSLTTAGIQAKLGDLVEDTNDVNNFEKAVNALKAKRSSFIPYRGNGGSVAEAGVQIARLQEDLDHAANAREQLSQMKADILALEQTHEEKTAAMAAVREQITAGSEAAAKAAVWQQYGALRRTHARTKEALAELHYVYPKGVPEKDRVLQAQTAMSQVSVYAGQQASSPRDAEAERCVEENRQRFAEGVPPAETITHYRSKFDSLLAASAELQSTRLLSQEEAQLERLQAFFAPGVPVEEELCSHSRNLNQANHLRQENLRLAAQAAEQPVPEKSRGGAVIWLAVLAGLLAVAGVAMLVLREFVIGGVLAGIGLIGILAAGYWSLRRMVSREVSAGRGGISPEAQAQIHANENLAAQLERETRVFVARYVTEDTDPGAGLNQIERFRQTLADLQEKQRTVQQNRARLSRQMEELSQELQGFLGRYYNAVEIAQAGTLLANLQRDCDAYTRSLETLRRWEERQKKYQAEIDRCATVVAAFAREYSLELGLQDSSRLWQIRDDSAAFEEASLELENLTQQLSAFETAHREALASPPAEQAADLGELKAQEKVLTENLTALTDELLRRAQQLAQLQTEADRIPELQDSLASWQEKRTEGIRNAATLDETMEFLGKAKDSLSGNYLGTLRDSFAGYMEILLGEDREKILLSPDLEVQLEREGRARELGYFSAGQTDLVMLCMRFALVDALFKETKPFVILDDPFVNLDDERTAQALELLQELSKDRQIIYLVCNSSRV